MTELVHDEVDSQGELSRFATKRDVGEIDREKGIIYGVSIVTIGEAKGHHAYVDETMHKQVVAFGKEKEPLGLKSRFDHPGACNRAIGTFTGRFHKFRRDEDQVRADLHLADVAATSPDGDFRSYILDLAEEDPKAFATSIVFRPDEPWRPDSANKGKKGFPPDDDPYWFPHARVKALHHCDIVDEGAANDGLFGRPNYWAEQAESWAREHPNALGRIFAIYYEQKQEREDKKMDEAKYKEMESELALALETGKEAVIQLADANTKIEELTAQVETKSTEAGETARTSLFETIKTRLEKFKDPKFVLSTIEKSDDDVKDAYIERLEKGDEDPDGVVDFTAAGGEGAPKDGEKFEDKVAEKVTAGMSKGEATIKCAKEFKDLHKEYIARTNKEREPAKE